MKTLTYILSTSALLLSACSTTELHEFMSDDFYLNDNDTSKYINENISHIDSTRRGAFSGILRELKNVSDKDRNINSKIFSDLFSDTQSHQIYWNIDKNRFHKVESKNSSTDKPMYYSKCGQLITDKEGVVVGININFEQSSYWFDNCHNIYNNIKYYNENGFTKQQAYEKELQAEKEFKAAEIKREQEATAQRCAKDKNLTKYKKFKRSETPLDLVATTLREKPIKNVIYMADYYIKVFQKLKPYNGVLVYNGHYPLVLSFFKTNPNNHKVGGHVYGYYYWSGEYFSYESLAGETMKVYKFTELPNLDYSTYECLDKIEEK